MNNFEKNEKNISSIYTTKDSVCCCTTHLAGHYELETHYLLDSVSTGEDNSCKQQWQISSLNGQLLFY